MAASKHNDLAKMSHENEKALRVFDSNASEGRKSDIEVGHSAPAPLRRDLQGRHMQMIAIGGAIGAGLFVGSGSALQSGGPASLVLCFTITGIMVLCTVMSLGEMAVLYPVNGAFFEYAFRFLDPAWSFAIGWNYAIGWLVLLPFEITAAGITISYWHEYNIGIWIAVFLGIVAIINYFGVRGYGEVEFVLSMVKIVAIVGFIIFGIIVNTGGVPTDDRGYIGFRYWTGEDDNHAFRNGFQGFCSVFVLAAFSFGGTELVGLAAAEASDPQTSIPKATKQVFFRIAFFYIVSLLILGIIVPNSSPDLLGSSGANTKASPFVLAMKYAGVKGLPSVFNAVITISVISVANSCTYASTRTMQALSQYGMGPRWLQYVDNKGRPIWCVLIQLAAGLLAFVNEAAVGADVFTWLLAFGGLSQLFAWGTINACHIRFRKAWKEAGRSTDELPFKSSFGIASSYIGLGLVVVALIATFYISLFPIGGSPDAEAFFASYLGAPFLIPFYIGWKIWKKDWSIYVPMRNILADLDFGRRVTEEVPARREHDMSLGRKVLRAIF